MDPQRIGTWPRIVAWLMLTSTVYVIAYGTWVWYLFRMRVSRDVADIGDTLFMPLESAAMNGPDWLMDPYRVYISWCSQSAGGPPIYY